MAEKARKKAPAKKKAAPRKVAPKKKAVAAKSAAKKKAPAKKKPPVKKPAAATAEAKKSRKFVPDDLQAHIDKVLNAEVMGRDDTHWIYTVLKRYFDPQLMNTDKLDPSRPTVYVANHCIFGVDGGVAPSAVLTATGRLPRLLTDSTTMLSGMEDTLIRLGQVLADRQVCDALMRSGEDIMVFPGGAREGTKLRGQDYQLMWEGRTGFVDMAMRHGYTITPFCTVGPDDMWEVVWDRNDVLGTPVADLLERLFPDLWDAEHFPPIPRGLGLTPIPRPEKFYLNFGEPFDTAPFKGQEGDRKLLTEIKDEVQDRVEKLIREAILERIRQRKTMGFFRRLLTRN